MCVYVYCVCVYCVFMGGAVWIRELVVINGIDKHEIETYMRRRKTRALKEEI